MDSFDFLIAGAGFSGSVCAQKLAEAGKKVLLVDKRAHIGGNAFDQVDEHGILIHPYGPHIFHTNSEKVFKYLSRFTDWRFYEHRVLAQVNGQLLPIPINKTTINKLYDKNLDEAGVASFLESVRIAKDAIETSEDVVLNSVGAELCDLFFRGYTRKQWGLDLSQLSAGVAARIPTRTDEDDRYFTDKYQFMPSMGYTKMFENMLNNPNITIRLETDFKSIIKNEVEAKKLIYTGPIDEYFDYQLGRLPYRSLQFQHEHAEVNQLQPVGTVNYPNEHKYTRITEFKHLTGGVGCGTSIVKEYPTDSGDPYYPIPKKENEELFKKYEKLAEMQSDVYFVGRLAQYRYYNMDQVVAAALLLSDKILKGN